MIMLDIEGIAIRQYRGIYYVVPKDRTYITGDELSKIQSHITVHSSKERSVSVCFIADIYLKGHPTDAEERLDDSLSR